MLKQGDKIKGGPWDGFEVIDTYTRAQAIEDGILVDVSKMAKEAGFKFPVAVTRTVWDTYITPDDRSREWGQSEEGRLWDTLYMLKCHINQTRTLQSDTDRIMFRLYFIMKERQRRLITLKALCGPGDRAEPVITIMLPEED